ncbi:hypothetical protein [uncultured Aquimarina sp.]|uniref:hypothetical protein n=1 Tax=uncultured Aquimarina sp. TaxID=575652 RepID=UPI00261C07C8|nr:hypothetical protein [uncultured Aquimarina sp.]
MLDSILKINGVQQLNREQQKSISAGFGLNITCFNNEECPNRQICCSGACINPEIVWHLPAC